MAWTSELSTRCDFTGMVFQFTDEGCSACERAASLAHSSPGSAAPEARRLPAYAGGCPGDGRIASDMAGKALLTAARQCITAPLCIRHSFAEVRVNCPQ